MLKKWIKSKSSVSIGVEIGGENIHVVVADMRAGEFKILHRIASKNDHEDSLHHTLRNSVLLSYVSSATIVIGISDELIVRKNAQLDVSLSDIEIERYMERLAKNIFPECCFDFHIIGINSVDSNKIDVEMVVADERYVTRQLMILEKAGYQVDIVDMNSRAIERAQKYILRGEIKNIEENYLISVGLALRVSDGRRTWRWLRLGSIFD